MSLTIKKTFLSLKDIRLRLLFTILSQAVVTKTRLKLCQIVRLSRASCKTCCLDDEHRLDERKGQPGEAPDLQVRRELVGQAP